MSILPSMALALVLIRRWEDSCDLTEPVKSAVAIVHIGTLFRLTICMTPSQRPAGSLAPGFPRDLLFIGTAENVQAHDVQANMDIFNKSVPDGVDALLVGPSRPSGERLLLVASSLSITGISASGQDMFWCVSNDVVSSLAYCDIDCDGRQELLAGSVSCDVHIYREVRQACDWLVLQHSTAAPASQF
jgi:hypothetical protein